MYTICSNLQEVHLAKPLADFISYEWVNRKPLYRPRISSPNSVTGWIRNMSNHSEIEAKGYSNFLLCKQSDLYPFKKALDEKNGVYKIGACNCKWDAHGPLKCNLASQKLIRYIAGVEVLAIDSNSYSWSVIMP